MTVGMHCIATRILTDRLPDHSSLLDLLRWERCEAHLLLCRFPTNPTLRIEAGLSTSLVVLEADTLALDGKLRVLRVPLRHPTVLLGDVDGPRLIFTVHEQGSRMLELGHVGLVLEAVAADDVPILQYLLLPRTRRWSSAGFHRELIVLEDELIDEELV